MPFFPFVLLYELNWLKGKIEVIDTDTGLKVLGLSLSQKVYIIVWEIKKLIGRIPWIGEFLKRISF